MLDVAVGCENRAHEERTGIDGCQGRAWWFGAAAVILIGLLVMQGLNHLIPDAAHSQMAEAPDRTTSTDKDWAYYGHGPEGARIVTLNADDGRPCAGFSKGALSTSWKISAVRRLKRGNRTMTNVTAAVT